MKRSDETPYSSAVTGRVFVAKTPEVFTYDADGNMTSDGRFTYTWNDENRMVSASNAEVVVTYAYDHRGRMVSKTLCASAPLRLIKSTTYIWDGWNIVRETFRTPNSSFLIHNLWGLDLDGTMQGAGGVGGLLAVVRDGETYIPTYDANGNISEYVSATDGDIAAHYDYSPFGETLVASGPLTASFIHRFSTKPWCPVTGFCEYQMRKYRPDIGRWMSRDPIGEEGGLHLYRFCGMTVIRGGFNLHTGRRSNGCVTVWSDIGEEDDGYPHSNDFDKLREMLDKTRPLRYKDSNYSGWLEVK